ncbi:hypothetical protein [Rhizomonospora bruguierae]|uniref:hypothetical protein n=1 Tax=Rhizomonospora bruguierae TaxID=1581705 RepID=UPI001BCEC026|nr:hypothetical protein [Micromonospora sp. NBRC 107566]
MSHHPQSVGTARGLTASNEFATVLVERVGDDPALLRISDLRRGRSVVLDPLELEAITRMSRDEIRALADPSYAGTFGQRARGEDFDGMVGDDEMQIEGISG